MFNRLIATCLCFCFSAHSIQQVEAQDFSISQLPLPGTMVGESKPFSPLVLKGILVNLQKPLDFQIIVDSGRGPQDMSTVKYQARQLVKYFLSGITIPEGDLWVNLSPYEKDRMVPEALGETILGRDLLAQDYILKQLTASLIFPENNLGKQFWNRVYAKAREQFGTTDISVNTYNKVWILPDQAQVFENGNAAYVTQSTLRVMLDEDYLATQKHGHNPQSVSPPESHSMAASMLRSIILPEIEKEVNTGKNFGTLRQIYQSLILAKWYKETIKNGLFDAVYTDKKKVAGINLENTTVKEQIYQRYIQAYKKGAFNIIREDRSPAGDYKPRKYFSGGLIWKMNIARTKDQALITRSISAAAGLLLLIGVNVGPVLNQASAHNDIPIPAYPDQQESIEELIHELNSEKNGDQPEIISKLARFGPRVIPYLMADLEDTHDYTKIESMYVSHNSKILRVLKEIGGPEAIKAVRENEDKLSYWQIDWTFRDLDADWYDMLTTGWRITFWTSIMTGLSGILFGWGAYHNWIKKIDREFEIKQRARKLRLENLRNMDPEVYDKLENELKKVGRLDALEELFPDALTLKMEKKQDFKVHYKHGEEIWVISGPDGGNTIPTRFDGYEPDELYIEPDEPLADLAMVRTSTITNVPENGGIDLNQINVMGKGNSVTVHFDQAQVSALMKNSFEGFTPVITHVTRVSSALQLLGILNGPSSFSTFSK